MKRFVWMGVVLQLLMVLTGHYLESVLMLFGILGTVIPFGLGLWFGATEPGSYTESAKGGFIIGIVAAVLAGLVSVLLGDQTWMVLTFAPLSSAVTGLLGAVIGTAAAGRANAG